MIDTEKDSKTKLLDAALQVIRAKGYAATRVEDICETAGLTKGSFFHHFKSKEDLALEAAAYWDVMTGGLFAQAPYRTLPDPLDRLLGYIDLRKALLQGELPQFTCLIGTMVQEIYNTHPHLREACGKSIGGHIVSVEADIAEAIQKYGIPADWTAKSLALYTQAVVQGSFILAKTTGGPRVAAECVDHLRRYIELLFNQPTEGESSMTTTQLESNEAQFTRLEPLRFEDGKSMLIAGFRGYYGSDEMEDIARQWERFVPHIDRLPAQGGCIAYGVCFLSTNSVDYLSGVEVSHSSGLPADFSVTSIPAQRYAVFAHHAHVSELGQTCEAIQSEWLPNSGYSGKKSAGEPDFFERYGEGFDPKTGTGDIEVWVPVS